MALLVYQEHVCLSVGFKSKKSCLFRTALRLHGLAAVFFEIKQESRVTSDSRSQNILRLCARCQPRHFPPCCSLSTSWPQIRQDYLLNLSIFLSRGRKTNKDSPSNGEWRGNSSNLISLLFSTANCSFEKYFPDKSTLPKLLGTARQRVTTPYMGRFDRQRCAFQESGCLGLQPKMGGKLHLKLNTGTRLIANKYPEGKMKRTLKRELKRMWNCWKGSKWS